MWQNFLHHQQCIAEGITVFLGNLLSPLNRITNQYQPKTRPTEFVTLILPKT